MRKNRPKGKRGPAGRVVFLFFDEETERLCKKLDLEICFPSARVRAKIDDKMMTARIGNKLVVQTAHGDSGHTTFSIANEKEHARHAKEIEREREVKVMKRVRCRGSSASRS